MPPAEGAPLDRRTLLSLTVAATAGVVLDACSSSKRRVAPSGTRTPSTRPPVASASSSARPTLDALARQLGGRLLRPGDSAYESAQLSANPRFDGVRPLAVASCASAADVATAVRFVRQSGMSFSVRSGGHGYPGWSTDPGLVIDTGGLTGVSVDRATGAATIGAGTRLVDVYGGVAAGGRAVAAGSCPTVGMGGLTLGGGVGVLVRAYGLTCDAMAAYDIVTADGRVRHVDARHEPDLLWAGRGGGGGSFGVVTGFTLATRPAPQVTTFYLSWPWSTAARVVSAWQAWAPVADRRSWATCKLLSQAGTPRVLVAGTWLGGPDTLDDVLAPLLDGVGIASTADARQTLGYLDAMLSEAGCTGTGCDLPPRGSYLREALAATSHVPPGPLSTAAVSALVGAVAAVGPGPAGLREAGVSLDALGGAVADVAPDATAFVHRRAPFTMQYTATWASGPDVGGAYTAVVQGLRTAMTSYAGDTAYVNYADRALADWPTAYWGANYPRLQQIKRAVDPDDLFHFPQSVRPAT